MDERKTKKTTKCVNKIRIRRIKSKKEKYMRRSNK